jgi:hypothetical protein
MAIVLKFYRSCILGYPNATALFSRVRPWAILTGALASLVEKALQQMGVLYIPLEYDDRKKGAEAAGAELLELVTSS